MNRLRNYAGLHQAEVRPIALEASRNRHLKAIIVNADDLGKTEEANHAIFELMARNRVSSATIMANGPAFEHAIRGLRQLRDRSFGIHLNLTEFEPLSRGPGTRLLTDRNGLLVRDIVRAAWKLRLLHAAYTELCAQVDRLVASGVSVSHIDSHHHVHTVPSIFPVIKGVQRRYGLRKIRISRNIYTGQTPCSPALRAKKLLYNWALRADSETTEGFTDLTSFFEVASNHTIRQRTIEIMVHPGEPRCERETALLSSPWEETLPFEIQHVNYKQFSRKALPWK
jgi:predicted glycoside hydrolase/deacetylase ChbG (UPF0249 family)